MPIPTAEAISPNTIVHRIACRRTSFASFSRSAPISCATCTENPVAAETHSPPNSQVVLETSPIAAVAAAPRLPTMDASIYCIMIELIWASTAGILSLMTCFRYSLVRCFSDMPLYLLIFHQQYHIYKVL